MFENIDLANVFSAEDITQNLIYTIGYLLGAIILLVVSRRVVKFIISRANSISISERRRAELIEKRSRTIGTLINNIASVVIWGIVLTMILAQWGVNIAPILAGAGVVGLAVGFGAQTLVRDVVTGFFILFENQYNVGDRIEVGGKAGKVTAVNLRSTVLKGDDGETFIIPNSRVDVITRQPRAQKSQG